MCFLLFRRVLVCSGSGTKSLGSWGWCLNASPVRWEEMQEHRDVFCGIKWRHLGSDPSRSTQRDPWILMSLRFHTEHVLLDAQWMDKTLDFEDTARDVRTRWGRFRWRYKFLSLKYSEWWLFLPWRMGITHIHTLKCFSQTWSLWSLSFTRNLFWHENRLREKLMWRPRRQPQKKSHLLPTIFTQLQHKMICLRVEPPTDVVVNYLEVQKHLFPPRFFEVSF